MYATYTVKYKIAGKVHILQPGQALMVWSSNDWDRVGVDLEICLLTLTATDSGELSGQPGYASLSHRDYEVASRSAKPGAEEARVLDQAKLAPLGGASRLAIIRPHRLPIGMGVRNADVSTQDKRSQYEEHKVTYSQAIGPVKKFNRRAETILPMPKLFIETPNGSAVGRDVLEGGKIVRLQETMLPVFPVPFQGDETTMEFSAAAWDHLKRLGAGGGGRVFLGFDIYPGRDNTQSTLPEPVDLERHRATFAGDSVLYTMPHGPADDYEQYLRLESEVKVHALLTGRDALYTEEIPLPAFVVGSPENVPPTFGWRTEDHLHETGII